MNVRKRVAAFKTDYETVGKHLLSTWKYVSGLLLGLPWLFELCRTERLNSVTTAHRVLMNAVIGSR